MGDRARRRARPGSHQTEGGLQQAAVAALAVFGAVSAIVSVVTAAPRWIPVGCALAACSIGYLAYRGHDWRSPRNVGVGILMAIVALFAARGASDLWPFGGYAGEFVVVDQIVLPRYAPVENTVGPTDLSYDAGDQVVVDCKIAGFETRQTWYRIKDEGAFVPEGAVAASVADPPGNPPDC